VYCLTFSQITLFRPVLLPPSNTLIDRLLRSWLVLLLAFGSGLSTAQLASLPSAGIEIAGIDVLHNTPPGLSLAQVLSGQAGAFVKNEGLQVQHSHWDRSFWLRIQLKSSAITPAAPDEALLIIPKSYLDLVRLFTPGDSQSSSWQSQVHGDFLPPDLWTHETLSPQFKLPTAAAIAASPQKQMTIYMQLDHLAPVMIDPQLISGKQSRHDDVVSYTVFGMLFGAIFLAAMLTAAQGWLYRDAIYVWYSAYAIASLLACMSHAGMAQQLLWRIGGYWPGTAVLFFMLFCCAFQLQFTRCIRDAAEQPRWQIWSCHLMTACCAVLAVFFVSFHAYWRISYFLSLGLVALTMSFATLMIVQAWRAGSQLAKTWLLASCPLWLTVVMALMEGIGILPTMAWSFNSAIYAAGMEVLLIGLALQWFARDRHGQKERERALATTDPLTGFATFEAFQQRLLRDWHALETQKSDMAVIYIELQTKASNSKHLEQLLMRSVRVLRSATHTHDLVARLDGQLMAILMPHVQMGDDLSQRLSRMVALGLMPDQSDLQSSILQFRIAATTRWHYSQPLAQLDADLRKLLAEPRGWGSKPIRYIDDTAPKRPPSNQSTAPDLDDIWERALGQQLQDSQPPIKPAA
jgi:two-component system, sensor histidine kinase LadS